MNRPCARYPELPIVRSCKQRKRRSATLFQNIFFCCRIFVKFLEGDLIWARIPSSICCGCCSFHFIPFIVKEKKKKKGINPSVEKRSKKRHISFLITSHQIAPLRSGRRSFASHLLSPERAALGQTSLTTGGLAENGRATGADDNGLGVREDGSDGEAAGALDVHEERARLGHKGLLREEEKFESVLGPWWTGGVVCSGYVATYLELVLTGLSLRRRVEEVDRENLLTRTKVSYLLLILQFVDERSVGRWPATATAMKSPHPTATASSSP